MNQEQFIARHEPQWQRLEQWLDADADRRKRKAQWNGEQQLDFPYLYRQVCHHLALARSRLYSQQLINRLDSLVLRAHQRFYRPTVNLREKLIEFAAAGFPTQVRREWRLVALAAVLFFGPLLSMLSVQQLYPEMVYTLMDQQQVQTFEAMYSPDHAERIGREGDSQSDFLMFGFYIRNNTGIGFQTFAGGLLFGLGSVFFLLFNGLYIGAVAGHLTQMGHGGPFWSFVAGHSALELTAIVLSGAAGLKLGGALIKPGRLSRLRSLRSAARGAITIVYGAALMFFAAAFVEAFWSSIAWVPAPVKYTVGLGLWLVVLGYFARMGRGAT